MDHPNRLGSPSFQRVARGLVDLHRLIAAGKEDSPEAESVRDAMDAPWFVLDPAEKERAQWLSEDLYSISDPPSTTDQREMNAEAQQQFNEAMEAFQEREWDRSLALLRRCQDCISPALLSYLRGRIWSGAGHPEVASVFHGHAARKDPTRANYLAIYLAVLTEVDPEEASRLAGEVLADEGKYAPIVVSRAAQIRFHEAGDAATSESVRLLRNLIPILERNLGRIEQDEGTPSRSLALHTSLGILGFCQERLGNAGAAVHYYSLGLQAKPEDDALLVARGILLYGSDPRALVDFEQAANLGSPLVWPYLFLAHHFLVSQQYDKCLSACETGLEKRGSDAAKSQLREWMAISRAELGFRPEFVRADFEAALRLDPSNELARRNQAAFEASLGTQPASSPGAWHQRSAMVLKRLGMVERWAA